MSGTLERVRANQEEWDKLVAAVARWDSEPADMDDRDTLLEELRAGKFADEALKSLYGEEFAEKLKSIGGEPDVPTHA